MAVNPIPEGYGTVTPYLYVKNAAGAIDFYKAAFGAVEIMRLADPSGRIGHAELQIGTSRIMLADEAPQRNIRGPETLGGSSVGFLIYDVQVDARFEQAVAAGARVLMPIKDQFYGDRSGTLEDPFGHRWTISTHVEDVPPDEMDRRFEALRKAAGTS
jgi:PhnB protein